MVRMKREQYTLWHFTAPHLVAGILRDGIALGVTPIRSASGIGFIHCTQWLTDDMSFMQEWCRGSSLPYDRTAYRLEVHIPKEFASNLLDYKAWRRLLRGRMLRGFCDSNAKTSWYIYRGIIPAHWITSVEAKERAA